MLTRGSQHAITPHVLEGGQLQVAWSETKTGVAVKAFEIVPSTMMQ